MGSCLIKFDRSLDSQLPFSLSCWDWSALDPAINSSVGCESLPLLAYRDESIFLYTLISRYVTVDLSRSTSGGTGAV